MKLTLGIDDDLEQFLRRLFDGNQHDHDLHKIQRQLSIIISLLTPPPPVEDEVEAYFNQVRAGGFTFTGEITMAELREGQFIPLSVAFRTQAGRPAVYEPGTVSWSSSDESIATVEADPNDELSARVVGVDGSTNGSAVIEFRADGDPDADQTRELIATLDVVVTQGEAVVAEITAGAAQDNPAIPTPGPTPEPQPEPIPAPVEPGNETVPPVPAGEDTTGGSETTGGTQPAEGAPTGELPAEEQP